MYDVVTVCLQFTSRRKGQKRNAVFIVFFNFSVPVRGKTVPFGTWLMFSDLFFSFAQLIIKVGGGGAEKEILT